MLYNLKCYIYIIVLQKQVYKKSAILAEKSIHSGSHRGYQSVPKIYKKSAILDGKKSAILAEMSRDFVAPRGYHNPSRI